MTLSSERKSAAHELAVPTTFDRAGRKAKMAIRTTSVTLDMSEPATGDRLQLPVNVVDVREVRTVPRGATPIHWRLLANRTIESESDELPFCEGIRNVGRSSNCIAPGSQARAASKKVSCVRLTL